MSEIEPCAFMAHYQYLAAACHLGGRSFLSELCASTRRRPIGVTKRGPKMLNARAMSSACYLLAPHFLLMVWAMSVPLAKV